MCINCAFLGRKHQIWYRGTLGGKDHFETLTHLQNTCPCILQTRMTTRQKKVFLFKICHIIYRWKAFFILILKNITTYIWKWTGNEFWLNEVIYRPERLPSEKTMFSFQNMSYWVSLLILYISLERILILILKKYFLCKEIQDLKVFQKSIMAAESLEQWANFVKFPIFKLP